MEYKDLEIAITEYLNNHNADYAILINGEWGSGKTFFFKNKIFNDKDHKYLYLSLADCEEPDQIIKNISMEYVYQYIENKAPKGINVSLMKGITSFFPTSLIAENKYGKQIGEVFDALIKKQTEQESEKIVLVLDDLERFCQDKIEKLLASIHINFIEKGAKVIYIANEIQIQNQNYSKIKEKYIRGTLEFSLDLSTVLKRIIQTHNSYTAFESLYDSNKENILQHIISFKISNLRIIMKAIDCFEYFLKNNRIDDEIMKTHFFYNILLLTDYNSTRANQSFMEYLKAKKLPNDPWGIYIHDESNYEANIYQEYEEVEDYLKTSYVNNDTINNFLNKYYPSKNEYAKALYKLTSKYPTLEEEEILPALNIILEGLTSNNIPYNLIPKISNWTEVFVKDFPEYKESLENKLLETITNDSIPRKNYFESNPDFTTSPNAPEFDKETMKRFKHEYEKYIHSKQKDQFICLMNSINEIEYRDIPSEFKGKLFEFICTNNMLDKINSLNNNGLFNLNLEAYNLPNVINNSSEAVKVLKYLHPIKERLEARLNTQNESTFRKNRIKDTIISLDTKIKSIEKNNTNFIGNSDN